MNGMEFFEGDPVVVRLKKLATGMLVVAVVMLVALLAMML